MDIPRNSFERYAAIKNQAFLLAQERGFSPGEEKNDWFKAEEMVDKMIFGQKLQPNELYSSLMIKFFSSIETDILDDIGIAYAYFDFIHSNHRYLKKTSAQSSAYRDFDFRNISLLMENTDLSFLSKRALLLADSTLLGHTDSSQYEYKRENTFSDGTYSTYADDFYYSNCPNSLELGYWLKNCRGLLESGDLFYYPRIAVVDTPYSYSTSIAGGPLQSPTTLFDDHQYDAIISSRKLVEGRVENLLKTNLVRAIVQIELPYVDNVDLYHFSKISCDEHQHLETFRDYIRGQFLEIDGIEGSESFESDLMKIGIEIQKGVKSLKSDFYSLNRKAAFQVAGATIATVVATLVAVDAQIFAQIAPIISAGGGLTAFLKVAEKFTEKSSRLKDNPHYYLWLLDRT